MSIENTTLGGFVCKCDIIHQTEDSLVLYNINPSFPRIKAAAIGLNLTELPLWGTTGKYSIFEQYSLLHLW